MSDPVEDGVRLLRYMAPPPYQTNDELRVIVRNIIAGAEPAPYLLDAAYARGVNDGTAAAVQAERERIRTGVRELPHALYAVQMRSVIDVIDGGT